jgi:long-chain acyl-CoA synthetase
MAKEVKISPELVGGGVDEGYGKVADVFRRNLISGQEVGAAVAVYQDGHLPMTTVCCPDPGAVTALLPRVQPQFFFSPPRLWKKLRAAIAPELAAGADVGDILHRTGFAQLQTARVGAAPCPPEVKEFFASIGIPLHQVYGLSETTGVVSISDRADTVGLPLPSAEVRLAGDGELLVRGPLVMTGYRNRPEATAEAIDIDGWLHTGDIARIDDDGQLRIIDRKKELIINAAGKNMSPANIEARLKESGGLISQACVIGNGRPYNVALILPDLALAAAYPTSAALTAELQADVDRANARLARVEQIKRFAVLSTEWQPDSDELTATMKLKRREIEKKMPRTSMLSTSDRAVMNLLSPHGGTWCSVCSPGLGEPRCTRRNGSCPLVRSADVSTDSGGFRQTRR